MRLGFHGAAQGVTGSCHLLEACGLRILVDCGFFQGSRELRAENHKDFGFDPASVDFVVLTHAHLDHCGRLPLLVEQGFKGSILATGATQQLARLVLEDTARLQTEEAERSRRHAKRGERAFREDAEALYDKEAVARACQFFTQPLAYGESLELGPNLSMRLQDAGHILGSASVFFEASENGRSRRVVFSGDLGSPMHPIVRDPEPCPEADIVLMECTYGGRFHRSPLETAVEFYGALRRTLDQGGNVLIPTFALERAQELLYALREGLEAGILPDSMKVFVDSPMATTATEIFQQHPECFDEHARKLLNQGRDPLKMPNLHFARDRQESKAINTIRSGAVILAGSGMCTGGRVLHHLEHLLPRPECAVLFVGFAAPGTLARTLIEGEREVQLFGHTVPVRARRYTLGGFSGHADHAQLLRWIREAGRPEQTLLIHGDPEALKAMGEDLKNRGHTIGIPNLHETQEL